VLPRPKHEPLSARSDPRTLEAFREHIHRKLPTPMFRLYEHRYTREQAAEPKRRLGDERGKEPRGDPLLSYERTMRVLRSAVVTLPPACRVSIQALQEALLRYLGKWR
jgi:hypothetical protein